MNQVAKKSVNPVVLATGTDIQALHDRHVGVLSEILNLPHTDEDLQQIVLASLAAFKPRDALEGGLVAQMVAVNASATECFRRAALPDQKPGIRDSELRHAEKLMNLFARLLEAFEKRRKRIEIEAATRRLIPVRGGL